MDALSAASWLRPVAGSVALLLLAWTCNAVVKRVLLRVIRRVAERTRVTWDDKVIAHRVFDRVANVAPAVVVYVGAALALDTASDLVAAYETDPSAVAGAMPPLVLAAVLARRVALAFVVMTLARAVAGLLGAADDIYRETVPEARERPIKGYLQVVSIFVYITAAVIAVAVLADRSPVVFLSGLGALTAVLLLVFRDTILSLVASVQIMSNDMIRLGDWVEMPQANADGDVIDIALHTVKIQNWDKTITTVPTHRFISESFRNWRGMSEAGGRRIKRALAIDLESVHFLDAAEIEHLSRYEFLAPYMERKRKELEEANRRPPPQSDLIPERRRLTNLGTFRAYVLHYLRHHPGIRQDMTLLVRQLPPGPQGIPLELYCFTRDTTWAVYESVQADIFDHLIAILPEFGLAPYQQPAGRDVRRALAASAEAGAVGGRGAEEAGGP